MSSTTARSPFVDPQRDIDRVLAILDEHAVRLTDVFETHLHNDQVTGGPALAAVAARRITSTSKTRGAAHYPSPEGSGEASYTIDYPAKSAWREESASHLAGL